MGDGVFESACMRVCSGPDLGDSVLVQVAVLFDGVLIARGFLGVMAERLLGGRRTLKTQNKSQTSDISRRPETQHGVVLLTLDKRRGWVPQHHTRR